MPETTSKSTKKYIIGNWKSNKNKLQVEQWFSQFSEVYSKNKNVNENIKAVICPAFTHLQLAQNLVHQYQLPLKIGAQNLSPFPQGAYTGEIAATQLNELVDYVIIGHSERRKNFHEDDAMLAKKVAQAISLNLKVIFCVPDSKTSIPLGVTIVAYEPVFAIGTGVPDTPENASDVIKEIKMNNKSLSVIYGGSVTTENISQFLQREIIDGVLPGKASLDPDHFYRMLLNATL